MVAFGAAATAELLSPFSSPLSLVSSSSLTLFCSLLSPGSTLFGAFSSVWMVGEAGREGNLNPETIQALVKSSSDP